MSKNKKLSQPHFFIDIAVVTLLLGRIYSNNSQRKKKWLQSLLTCETTGFSSNGLLKKYAKGSQK